MFRLVPLSKPADPTYGFEENAAPRRNSVFDNLRGTFMQAIIVGAGHTRFGRHEGQTLEGLLSEAASDALRDAGMDGTDIDAVYLGHFNNGMVGDGFASSLVQKADPKLRFKPAVRCENACASGSAALYAALDALAAGTVRAALVVGAEKMTEKDTKGVTQSLAGAGYQNDPIERELTFPGVFARYAALYNQRYGDHMETLAHIAVKNHENALNNPLAHMHRALPFEFCNTISEKNPLIADPLRLTDCSLITDGAAALVVTRADRASAEQFVSRIRGRAQVNDQLPLKDRDLLAFEGPRRAVAAALTEADLTIEAIDFAEVHDCFTIAELLAYEALGLVPQGKGRRVVDEGWAEKGGKLPVNVSGGLKAKGHPIGATGVSMAVLAHRQLTGQAGAMQLPHARRGLCFNMGGAGVANYVTVLEAA